METCGSPASQQPESNDKSQLSKSQKKKVRRKMCKLFFKAASGSTALSTDGTSNDGAVDMSTCSHPSDAAPDCVPFKHDRSGPLILQSPEPSYNDPSSKGPGASESPTGPQPSQETSGRPRSKRKQKGQQQPQAQQPQQQPRQKSATKPTQTSSVLPAKQQPRQMQLPAASSACSHPQPNPQHRPTHNCGGPASPCPPAYGGHGGGDDDGSQEGNQSQELVQRAAKKRKVQEPQPSSSHPSLVVVAMQATATAAVSLQLPQQQRLDAVPNHQGVLRPIRPPLTGQYVGPGVQDLSSMLRIIQQELRVPPAVAAASAATATATAADSQRGAADSSAYLAASCDVDIDVEESGMQGQQHQSLHAHAQVGFCRQDMSQQTSMITAELSLSYCHEAGAASAATATLCDAAASGLPPQLEQPGQHQHPHQEEVRGPGHSSKEGGAEEDTNHQGQQADELHSNRGLNAGGGDDGDGIGSDGHDDDAQGHEEGPHGQDQEQQQQHKKPKQMCPYGNYHRYYGYRQGGIEADARLKLFQRSWFHGRDVLDVGCNEGLITLAVATRFGTRRMTGVDIDEVLVRKACRNLREMRHQLTQRLQTTKITGGMPPPPPATPTPPAPASAPQAAGTCQGGGEGVAALGSDATAAQPSQHHHQHSYVQPHLSLGTLAAQVKSLSRTMFRHEDWQRSRTRRESYDTIMCLSVTKWVHLNHGDEGMKRFFKKLADSLVPGGLLVLEPQPWRSYQAAGRKRHTCHVPFRHIESLALRPQHFQEHLAQVHGFELVADLNQGSSAKGFDRPLFVMRKPSREAMEQRRQQQEAAKAGANALLLGDEGQ